MSAFNFILYPAQLPSHAHRSCLLEFCPSHLLHANLSLRVCFPWNLTYDTFFAWRWWAGGW